MSEDWKTVDTDVRIECTPNRVNYRFKSALNDQGASMLHGEGLMFSRYDEVWDHLCGEGRRQVRAALDRMINVGIVIEYDDFGHIVSLYKLPEGCGVLIHGRLPYWLGRCFSETPYRSVETAYEAVKGSSRSQDAECMDHPRARKAAEDFRAKSADKPLEEKVVGEMAMHIEDVRFTSKERLDRFRRNNEISEFTFNKIAISIDEQFDELQRQVIEKFVFDPKMFPRELSEYLND